MAADGRDSTVRISGVMAFGCDGQIQRPIF
nr:MAG TPA: hypothetical protein [Caudoviricetes sp.]